jgi:hypothetical protein
MASGYEQSPDYGGPEPNPRTIILTWVIVALSAVALVKLRHKLGWFG